MTSVASNGSPATVSKNLTDQEINTISVALNKDSDGYGFNITGGCDEPYLPDEFSPFITRIRECGVAEKDGRLTINDISTDGKSHDDIISMFRDESTVNMLVEKGAEQRILDSCNQYSMTPSPLTSFANLSIFKLQQDPMDESDSNIVNTIANSIKQTLAANEIVLPKSPVNNTEQRKSISIIYPIAAAVIVGIAVVAIVRAARSHH